MTVCEYLKDGTCAAIGELCDTEPVAVSGDTCERCTRPSKGEPQGKNSVTAYEAMKHLSQHDQQKLASKRKSLQSMLPTPRGGCGDAKTDVSPKRLHLLSGQSPGDIMTLTAAVRSLHATYPNVFSVSVQTTAMEIWENNPDVIAPGDDKPSQIPMQYPLIHQSNSRNVSFLSAYADFLAMMLGVPVPLTVNRPQLHLSEEEHGWMGQVQEMVGGKPVKYWVVDAGVKNDFTCKQWPIEYYQEVVNRTRHLVEWVQVGANEHDHPLLDNVIDLRGETPGRKFIRLVYHSQGGLGPVTYLQHLCAAWEKPYLCMLGGREPVTWVSYPLQTTFHTIGQLDCCRYGACWKSRVMQLDDQAKQNDSLCEQPVPSGIRPVGRCMKMITPDEVVAVLCKQIGGI
jgi:ADP-heptose:LPS heptosyltransferase